MLNSAGNCLKRWKYFSFTLKALLACSREAQSANKLKVQKKTLFFSAGNFLVLNEKTGRIFVDIVVSGHKAFCNGLDTYTNGPPF